MNDCSIESACLFFQGVKILCKHNTNNLPLHSPELVFDLRVKNDNSTLTNLGGIDGPERGACGLPLLLLGWMVGFFCGLLNAEGGRG